jgi:hypothetical protein
VILNTYLFLFTEGKKRLKYAYDMAKLCVPFQLLNQMMDFHKIW